MVFQDLTNDPVWKFSCYTVDYDEWLKKLPDSELTTKLVSGFEVIKETIKEIIQNDYQKRLTENEKGYVISCIKAVLSDMEPEAFLRNELENLLLKFK